MSGDARAAAEAHFRDRIATNPYPGRGLVVGRTAAGAWAQVYWIMGRSPHSQNRRFVAEGSSLRTEPVDASQVEDPSLIIYEAMLELPGLYLVTNGDQTRTLADGLAAGGRFEALLAGREREPDAPNYTPRISALLDLRGDVARLSFSVLRANALDPEQSDRHTFEVGAPSPGLGLGLTTYEGDGQPLPPFRGEPLWMPLAEKPEELLERYWEALDAQNRVALAVKEIGADGGSRILVRNRFP